MRKYSRLFVPGGLVVLAAVTVTAFGATSALADPPGGTANREFVAVGSDTIQSLFDGIAYGYGSHAAVATNLDSWDAFGSATVPGRTLGSLVGPAFTRPGGSGAGRQALSASWDPANPIFDGVNLQEDNTGTNPLASVDIARSSGQPSAANLVAAGAAGDNLTSVPIARDAVDVAVGSGLKGVITNITSAQLLDLYTGVSANGVVFPAGGGDPTLNGTTVHVQLPQSNSGTRQFFLTALTGTQTPSNLWSGVDTAGDTLQENTASDIVSDGIIPFSAAQFIAQFNGIANDTGVGSIGLLTVDGRKAVDFNPANTVASADTSSTSLYGDTSTPIGPQVPNPTGNLVLSRDVYAVVPSLNLTGSTTYDTDLRTLVTSTIPGDTTAIQDFGFRAVSFYGTAADYLHSKFEH